MSQKIYPVEKILRPERLNNGRAIPIADVRLYWARNEATASLDDIDPQPLDRDEKELPESTVRAQGMVHVPLSWISDDGRNDLHRDKVLSQWTIKEIETLDLNISFRYWRYYFRDDRHATSDHLFIFSRARYPHPLSRQYRVLSMEPDTLYASLSCLNRSEIFSAIKYVCSRTKDDNLVRRSPRWLIDELFDRRELGLALTREVIEFVVAAYAPDILAWLMSDQRQKPHFPKRGLFEDWSQDIAPGIRHQASNAGRPRLPTIIWSLRQWMKDQGWDIKELQRHADKGPFIPRKPPRLRHIPNPDRGRRNGDAMVVDSSNNDLNPADDVARPESHLPNDDPMYDLFGTPEPPEPVWPSEDSMPLEEPGPSSQPPPPAPPADPEVRALRASKKYQWECRKRLPKYLQLWHENSPSTLGHTWWKCPLLNLEIPHVEARCHLRLDFTSERFTRDLYALLRPTTAAHLRMAIRKPPGFFEMDFLKQIGYNIWDRAIQEVTRYHNRWHLWSYGVGVLYESQDWESGEEYVKLEELSEAELTYVRSQLKPVTLFYRDENDDSSIVDVVPRLPASFWDVTVQHVL